MHDESTTRARARAAWRAGCCPRRRTPHHRRGLADVLGWERDRAIRVRVQLARNWPEVCEVVLPEYRDAAALHCRREDLRAAARPPGGTAPTPG
jgi:hypothetical protein